MDFLGRPVRSSATLTVSSAIWALMSRSSVVAAVAGDDLLCVSVGAGVVFKVRPSADSCAELAL